MGVQHSSHHKQNFVSINENRQIYRLINMNGEGILMNMMRLANAENDHTPIDEYIATKLPPHMYNRGRGKLYSTTELIMIRNKERNERLHAFSRKKGKGKSSPNVLDAFNQEGLNAGDLQKALKLLDGGGKGNKSKYRELVWRLNERGSMGESIIGVCLMQGTDIHYQLVKKLVNVYPKLVNDVSISEDYYGLSPLHQAIINEDANMVLFLIKSGADIAARCYGAFFCAEDQKDTRTDSLEYEWVDVKQESEYSGHMYFGEYPLSFAACMNNVDLFDILIAAKANPNAQDTNGNTVIHMCVIHEHLEILTKAVNCGGSLHIKNNQNLTPLTLATKLAKKEIFMHILELEGTSLWLYGQSSSSSYPLSKIDTINDGTGELNENSALALIVYGEQNEHLDLIDGVIETLLEAKWKTYGKLCLAKSFFYFVIYYIMVVASYQLRHAFWVDKIKEEFADSDDIVNDTDIFEATTYDPKNYEGSKLLGVEATRDWKYFNDPCHIRDYFGEQQAVWSGYARIFTEFCVLIGIIAYLAADVRDFRRIGAKKFWSNLKCFPAKVLFKLSHFLFLFTILTRIMCPISRVFLTIDNTLCSVGMLFVSFHFLYYCRAFKFVGPFVVMIYKIIATDLLCFLCIYGIFLIGFSQAFYIIFLSCERNGQTQTDLVVNNELNVTKSQAEKVKLFQNIMTSPLEAFIRTFILTIGEFTTLYRNITLCPSTLMGFLGRFVFVVFELFVSILQLNLLIAMMQRTYDTVLQTRKEYQRQWAQVILMLETSLSPQERLKGLLQYSVPTGTNKEKRSLLVTSKLKKELSFVEQRKVQEDKEREMCEERRLMLLHRSKDHGLDTISKLILLSSRS